MQPLPCLVSVRAVSLKKRGHASGVFTGSDTTAERYGEGEGRSTASLKPAVSDLRKPPCKHM